MFPVILNPTKLKIILVGSGPAAKRRYKLLKEAGGDPVRIKGIPVEKELEGADLVMIADFDRETTGRIYHIAKQAGAIVNAEDCREFCDYHVPAIVRRGDLLLTVSTGGKSPRLAQRIKQKLAEWFGEEWADRVEEVTRRRVQWREAGVDMKGVSERTDKLIDSGGWLD